MDMWGFDREFQIMSTIGTIFFVIVGTLIIGSIIAGIRQWSKNNNSPRLSVRATVVNMRVDVSHHHSGINEHSSMRTSTSYYVTSQVESGDRMELRMSGEEYDMLAIGDTGTLSFQGTRYMGFERNQRHRQFGEMETLLTLPVQETVDVPIGITGQSPVSLKLWFRFSL